MQYEYFAYTDKTVQFAGWLTDWMFAFLTWGSLECYSIYFFAWLDTLRWTLFACEQSICGYRRGISWYCFSNLVGIFYKLTWFVFWSTVPGISQLGDSKSCSMCVISLSAGLFVHLSVVEHFQAVRSHSRKTEYWFLGKSSWDSTNKNSTCHTKFKTDSSNTPYSCCIPPSTLSLTPTLPGPNRRVCCVVLKQIQKKIG